jgi:hypothetical protein
MIFHKNRQLVVTKSGNILSENQIIDIVDRENMQAKNKTVDTKPRNLKIPFSDLAGFLENYLRTKTGLLSIAPCQKVPRPPLYRFFF